MMARAAKICEKLTAQQIEAAYDRIDNGWYFELPPGDFLSNEQDARGLPPWMQRDDDDVQSRCDIYDYETIPEMVITNGKDDWPYIKYEPILTA